MTWVRIDDSFYDHAKFRAVGPIGVACWVIGLAYCNRNLTDGFIPYRTARRLVDCDGLGVYTGTMSGRDAEPIDGATELVKAGLWLEVEGGYRVHDYHEYQPTSEQVRDERRKNAGRQATWRDRHRNAVTNADDSAGSGNADAGTSARSATNPPDNGGSNAVTPPRSDSANTPRSSNEGSNAVTDAVTNAPVTGAPVPVPVPKELTTRAAPTDVDASNVKQLRPRKPDIIFDALLAACSPGVKASDMTKSEHGKYSKAVGELREAGRRADRSDEQIAAAIPERARAYERRWPGTLTALALVGHWADLRPQPRAQGRAVDR